MVDQYMNLLKKEMLPAYGCTEPIALAFAAAKAREVLGAEPVDMLVRCSGNMIKNSRCVVVPGSGGLKGIEISSILGAFAGDPEKNLEVLETVKPEDVQKAKEAKERGLCRVEHEPEIPGLFIDTTLWDKDGHSARVVIQNEHTNVVKIEHDGQLLYDQKSVEEEEENIDFSFNKILNYSKSVDYKPIQNILDLEIELNTAIAEEGLKNDWGAGIGRSLYDTGNQQDQEIAYAAAGSDARMSGCELPVVINSGSGNQGLTVSLPIVLRAKNIGASKDSLYRALIFANLVAEYQKFCIGRLSAYCGAVSASASAAAGIAFLEGASEEVIANTVGNTLAICSGMVCDGAKASCAGKIATALRTAYQAYEQAKRGKSFNVGDGLVGISIDDTIRAYGKMANQGMHSTDCVILDEMLRIDKEIIPASEK